MAYKKYHRRYPDRNWDYRGISTMVDGREVIFYTLIDNGEKSSAVEIYGGRNYIVESSSPSYSRRYLLDQVPVKYKKVVAKLMSKHRKTKWSKNKYVNLN